MGKIGDGEKKVNGGRLDEEGKKVKQKRGRKNKKEKQR